MTKKEALQILAILKAAYPASYQGMTKEEASGTVGVWAMQFENMPVDIVMMAVQKCISTNKFPPTVAEVKNKLQSIHWEAYDVISDVNMRELLPAETVQKCRNIYEVTQEYRNSRIGEPSITQMLPGCQRLMIGE